MQIDNSQFHILIVDDQRSNIDLVSSFLEEDGYSLSFTTNGKDALKAAFEYEFDLILLDINMPQMDGFAVCKRLKNDSVTKEIPIIFLSGASDINSIAMAFRLGAVDYVSKPFNGLELRARVNTHIQIRKYILEIQDKQNRLAQIVSTDQVTKIPNRIRFTSALKQSIEAVSSEQTMLSLIYLSIDNLNKINDIYGYEGADKLLYLFAKMVKKLLREEFVFARLFGAEFVIMMPNTSKAGAFNLAAKVKEQTAAAAFVQTRVTCTSGITEYTFGETFTSFVKRAEALMHQGKTHGGNVIIG